MIATVKGAMLDEAIRLASIGWRVFPLQPNKKTPWAGSRGVSDATTDLLAIERWWTQAPHSNIGLAMGGGAIALDVDPGATERYGAESIAELELDSIGTPRQSTPRGGFHLFYRLPAGMTARNSAGRIGDGLDIRGEGGYVVVAPSRGVDQSKGIDGVYEWIEPINCAPGELPQCPQWLIEAINSTSKTDKTTSGVRGNATGEPIPEGQRNATLASIAGSLRMLGHSAAGVLAALQVVNAERCAPPLDDREVEQIAASVSRYEPDEKAQRMIEASVATDPAGSPAMRNLAGVIPENVSWLWPGRFPLGKLSIIAGLPGLGKSVMTLDLASRTSTGSKWPDGEDAIDKPSGVVLVSAEDDAGDTIVPRLLAAGADLSRINILDGVCRGDGVTVAVELGDCDVFAKAIDQTPDCKLLVIDPVAAYSGRSTDTYKDSDVRGLLAPLAALASEKDVAILLVAHLNKSSGGAAIHRVGGSGGWTAATRAAWLVTESLGDPDGRLMLPLKTNLSRRQSGLSFSLVDHFGSPAISWDDTPVDQSADDALNQARATERESPAMDEACEFLETELLAEPAGIESKELKRRAIDAGHSWATIKRAKKPVGVEAHRRGGVGANGEWWWVLKSEATTFSTKSVTPYIA